MGKYTNPILKGFYPDPSICRVGEDYYLVTSTFTYFPGVPIFHSRDLVHWEQIGHVLDRPSQLPLSEGEHSHGIFAPSLRYHEGTFYMVTTNVANGGNFFVTAHNPAGPWSDPYWLETDGIDPSLFFDEDGRCWYCGTKDRREGAAYYGDNEIFIQELDLKDKVLIGPSYPAWHGAMKNAVWAEGPHIYKKDGWYYLLISEGGTGHEHALTIARSRSLTEEFEGYDCNPILTHRHLGKDYPIVNVGHGDLVETQDGDWWMVLLASRPYGGYYRNLGRETFLVSLVWEDGWPVVNPGEGIVPFEAKYPDLPEYRLSLTPEKMDFDGDGYPMSLIWQRNPIISNYDLTSDPGWLRMKLTPVALNSELSPSMVCVRQQSMSFSVDTRMDFRPNKGECAGLCLYQSNHYYYTLERGYLEDGESIRVLRCDDNKVSVVAAMEMPQIGDVLDLKIEVNGQDLSFYVKKPEEEVYRLVVEKVDGRILSTDVAGGFVGTVVGLFACNKAETVDKWAAFDWLQIINRDNEEG